MEGVTGRQKDRQKGRQKGRRATDERRERYGRSVEGSMEGAATRQHCGTVSYSVLPLH